VTTAETNLEIVDRREGDIVPESLSVTQRKPGGSYRIHLAYQKKLEDGRTLRVKFAIPRETAADLSTWSCYEVIQELTI